eukprot:scaffold30943_cov103-Isochrysis_galbana.AAC.1
MHLFSPESLASSDIVNSLYAMLRDRDPQGGNTGEGHSGWITLLAMLRDRHPQVCTGHVGGGALARQYRRGGIPARELALSHVQGETLAGGDGGGVQSDTHRDESRGRD